MDPQFLILSLRDVEGASLSGVEAEGKGASSEAAARSDSSWSSFSTRSWTAGKGGRRGRKKEDLIVSPVQGSATLYSR